jgi:adenylate cyclase
LTDKAGAGQVAVLRSSIGNGFVGRKTWFNGSQFVSQSLVLMPGGLQDVSALTPSVDPTTHPTFQTTTSRSFYGQIISTDLHWSQIDEKLPEAKRRVELSVQKVIKDTHGNFVGVLRIGLMKSQIDGAVQRHITAPGEVDPHLIFICDKQGRLITGFGNRDHVVVSDDDLRIAASEVPPVVAMAVKDPALQQIDSDHPDADSACSFKMNNKIYLCTFRYLPGTQDWIVGIVVPRDFYLGKLTKMRVEVLEVLIVLMAAILVSGWLISRLIVKSQSLILRETAKMKEFEFSSTPHSVYLRDVAEVLDGLEQAKTAMRAMSKYVPINLVRQLYHKREEPSLGGKSCELSVMFTDIKEFTVISEELSPDYLAEILGRYLQVIAETIQSERGTVDKYIGDSVMTFWNAPEEVEGHAILACRAALRCQEALNQLYSSPTWGAAPRFETRFGLHRCVASVGHFGAPDRLNYTAIGDGINLASRLEGLNKFYGTHIIVSETIYEAAKSECDFRLLDRVAVKGRIEGLFIYELIALREKQGSRPDFIATYEEAFVLYKRGNFADATTLLAKQVDDPPSARLLARCRDLMKHPLRDWNGVHVFDSK